MNNENILGASIAQVKNEIVTILLLILRSDISFILFSKLEFL